MEFPKVHFVHFVHFLDPGSLGSPESVRTVKKVQKSEKTLLFGFHSYRKSFNELRKDFPDMDFLKKGENQVGPLL